MYNELENSGEAALFSQETRSDLANAVSEATNSLLFKEQLKIIESNLGENSQSFINGMCEDILLELAEELASGGKASAKSLERKILNSFTDANRLTPLTIYMVRGVFVMRQDIAFVKMLYLTPAYGWRIYSNVISHCYCASAYGRHIESPCEGIYIAVSQAIKSIYVYKNCYNRRGVLQQRLKRSK